MVLNAAFVTLLTKPSYLPGVLVLHRSLQSVGSAYPLVVMVTPQLPEEAKRVLKDKDIKMREIQPLSAPEGKHQIATLDERFRDTWTKLRAFELVEYDRVILLDCDMLARKNIDELMTMELRNDWVAAVHACACNPRKFPHYPADWVPENCAYTPLKHPSGLLHPTEITPDSPRPYGLLNSGGVVLHPSRELSDAILKYLATSDLVPSFKFPDQDLISTFFKGKWKPLPYVYNALKTLRHSHAPLWRDEEVKCLHYVLHDKPWMSRPRDEDPYADFNRWWWSTYDSILEQLRLDGGDWQYVDKNVAH